MELYLIRHGIAAERGKYIDDELRPLTDKGREKLKKMAKRLTEIGIHFDLILTSPLLRSRQTSEILHEVGLSTQIQIFSPLAPGGQLSAWVNWYLESDYNGTEAQLALVGHQPDLGNWAEVLIWGRSEERLVVKKGGAIGLNLPEEGTPIARSELFLLTSPKYL